MKIDVIVKALGTTNSHLFDIIKTCGLDTPRGSIPVLLKAWVDHVFANSSKTYKLRTARALRNAGWQVDKVIVPCSRCGGTGKRKSWDGISLVTCYPCAGTGKVDGYMWPPNLRAVDTTFR